MNIKLVAVTLAFALAPVLASAQGCSMGKEQQAMTCAEGSNFDHATGTCMPVST